MKKETNKEILLADFSKDYNAFRNVYSILFPLFGLFTLSVFTIYFGKFLGYSSEDLSWIFLISSDKVPFDDSVIGIIGATMTFLMSVLFITMGMIYLFRGKISWVVYDPVNRELVSRWNGILKKERRIPIDEIKYLRKKIGKKSPGYISTGQHHVTTFSFSLRSGYAVMRDTNQYIKFFEYYVKKEFDQTFRDINKFIKEKKAG
tara:strand:- start:3917 stop:4528 length:612 start_codon:yes stop_codon:yes gene_type:complete